MFLDPRPHDTRFSSSRTRPSLLVVSIGLGLSLLCAEPSSAQVADAADEPTEEMVVTGSRAPRSRTTLSQSVSVLRGEDLDSSISTSLDDALRFVPGLQITREGARGGRAQLSLRGLDPNHTVVLIDGVRLNDPTNSRGGSFDPTTLALTNIERVEIVRGPLSAVYGSDALGGAINIITKRIDPSDPVEASVRIRGGRFHTGNVIAQASGGVGDVVGISLGAALDTFRDPNSDGGYDGANLKGKISTPLPGGARNDFFVRIHRGSARGFPESSGGPELATLRSMEDRNVREILIGTVFEIPVLDLGTVEVRASRTSRREELDSPGIAEGVPTNRSGDEYQRYDVSLVSRWDLPKIETGLFALGTNLVLGADAAFEDGEIDTYLDFGSGFFPNRFFDHRETVGIFGEIEESIGEYVTVSASLRFDTTPDEDDRFSPAAGIAIRIPSTTLVLFGNYGEGFKRPSFFALGNPLVGNRNLLLEKSRGGEIGLRATALEGRLSGQISYFDMIVRNLIDFDGAAILNRGRLVSRGVELEMNWQALEWLDFRGGATFNYTNFAGTGVVDPTNRPQWRGYAEVALQPTNTIELSLRVLGVDTVKATSLRTGGRIIKLNAYERVDIRGAWSPVEWVDLFVEIENLTNRTYREAVGFESPGIAPRAGVTFRM